MTTTAIFKDTKELRQFVRIHASTHPEVWRPGVPLAKQQIARYISAELLDKVETFAKDGTGGDPIAQLLPCVQHTMAPMIMLNISAEMSMNIGDGGHSVLKNETTLPASDAKISKYEDSLKQRIDQCLTALINLFDTNVSLYPDYEKSDAYKRRFDCLFRSAMDLETIGLVHIQNSHIAYETLRESIIKAQERFILPKLGKDLYNELLNDVNDVKQELKKLAARFCANRAIAHYLEANKNNTDKLPIIPADYSGDADFYLKAFETYLIENAESLGVTIFKPAEFNHKDSKIFSAIP